LGSVAFNYLTAAVSNSWSSKQPQTTAKNIKKRELNPLFYLIKLQVTTTSLIIHNKQTKQHMAS
jgi:hypothetical protein